jgi:hypothetical protein
MPLDSARFEDTKAWLIKAGQDLHRVEILLAITPPDLEDGSGRCLVPLPAGCGEGI